MTKYVDLYRHTDNDADVLTQEGIEAAVSIGRSLAGGYRFLVSTGAQRATQTAGCFLAGLPESVLDGILVEKGLRSRVEDRWFSAYQKAGAGDLESLRTADPELVEEDSAVLGEALLGVFDRLTDGDRALVVGHSPTNEAAVLGLTGEIVAPLSKGEGIRLIQEGTSFIIEPI